jgi:hypothetical protein
MTFNERFLDNETQIAANRTDIDDLLSRIEWEQEDSAWQMRESTSPDLYDTAYIDAMEETLSDAIGEKLDKNLGTANAGNVLVVGVDGGVTTEEPLIKSVDTAYLENPNGVLGVNSVIPDRLNGLDAAVAAVNTALNGKLGNKVDAGLVGQVITVSQSGDLLPAVSRPLWNNLQQKPFSALKPEHFTVQSEELSVNDRWTGGINAVQNNLNAETARIDGVDAGQNALIQNLQNSKLNIPFNIADGNIAVFSNTPSPGVADIGVKPTDFLRWTQIQRVPVLWV